MRGPTIAGLLGLFVVAAGCGREPVSPTGGVLEITLTTPNADDGAILFTISGGAIDSVESAGYTTFSAPLDGNSTRIVVAGNVASGVIVRLWVPDTRKAGEYTTVVEQAAARGSYGLQEVGGYGLVVR